MKTEIIISGYGGQGVMLAGSFICQAGIEEDLFVTFFPSYGAEMRGGTANCQVIISESPIGSPVVYNPDILIAFNQQAFNKFYPKVKEQGTITTNSDIVDISGTQLLDGKRIFPIPANTLADKEGDPRVANSITLGYLSKALDTISLSSLEKAIPKVLGEKKKDFWDINIAALKTGCSYSDPDRIR